MLLLVSTFGLFAVAAVIKGGFSSCFTFTCGGCGFGCGSNISGFFLLAVQIDGRSDMFDIVLVNSDIERS